jgi:hypothetical protein
MSSKTECRIRLATIAAALDAEVVDRSARGGHVTTGRMFGPLNVRAYYIPDYESAPS